MIQIYSKNIDSNRLERVLKIILKKNNRGSLMSSNINTNSISNKAYKKKFSESSSIEDLLNLYGEEFIKKAYNSILYREPDPKGKTYFSKALVKGTLNKKEVIALLLCSKEGRKKNKKVPLNLFFHAIKGKIKSIPVMGNFLIWLKNFIFLFNLSKQINALEFCVNTKISFLNQNINEISKKIEFLQNQIQKIEQKFLKSHFISPTSEEKFKPLSIAPEYIFAFENNFRGKEQEIKIRQKEYLKELFWDGKNPILDAGCGRGEFLELLKEANIEAIGVDMSPLHIKTVTTKGLKGVCEDVVKFLKSTDLQFSSIVSFQMIEHLDINRIKEFIKLSYEKLVPRGRIIIETVNPWCIEAFARFYMDETHKTPIPPELLGFLLFWTGFKNIKIKFSSPIISETNPEILRKFYSSNKVLYADYAIIATKEN